MVSSPAEIAQPFDRSGIEPLDESDHKFDRAVKIASIHSAVVRMRVADRHDDIHGRDAAIRQLNGGRIVAAGTSFPLTQVSARLREAHDTAIGAVIEKTAESRGPRGNSRIR